MWQERPGGPRPLSSGGSPKGRAGGLGSRCLWGESRVPVLLLVSSERGSPQGPEEAGQTLPSSPPPRGWVGAACSQGLLLRIQIKQFHKPSRGLSRLSTQGPGLSGGPSA